MPLSTDSKRYHSSNNLLPANQLGDSAYLCLSKSNLFLSQLHVLRLFVYQNASLDTKKVHELARIYSLEFRILQVLLVMHGSRLAVLAYRETVLD
jgi:hypothetical protein